MMKSPHKLRQSLQSILVACAMILMLAVPTLAADAGSFSDVLSGKWYTQAVSYCARKGYVSGYEDGTFRPNNKLTRAEMAAIMNTMLGLNSAAQNAFSDIPSGKWYTKAVLQCVKAGIMSGYSEKQFGPSDTLNREQGAVILAKAFQVDKASGRTGFTDDASISKWAVESVKAMSAKGLITGMGNNLFSPKTPLTRAQMCQIIYAAEGKTGENEKGERSPEGKEESETSSQEPVPSELVLPGIDETAEIQIGEVEEQTTQSDWDIARKDYQEEEDVGGSITFDVDGDDELEMITYTQDGSLNMKLITYHDGKVSILPLNGASVAYVPGENKILTGEYRDSTYYLSIYSIEDSSWVRKSVGSFQVEGDEFDDEAFHFTNCQWDGQSMELIDFFEAMAEKIDVEKLVQINEE